MSQAPQPRLQTVPLSASSFSTETAHFKTKLQRLLALLNQGLIEREAVLKAALLTVLAEENLVLVGPPGTGKSLVARRIAQVLSDDQHGHDYFEYLLTKFSTPEELFGPLSISELKADRFKRNTHGYLPTVNVAFLDEIFKASSSILNALLTILNERVYHNGAQAQAVPLQALIAASNELPTEDEALGALYDRFLVRIFVDYVSENRFALLFNDTTEPEFSPEDRLTRQEIDRLRQAAKTVTIPNEIAQAIQSIWQQHKQAFQEDARESLSDRRLKKIIKLLRVSAASNGRREVDLSDVLLLKDCLWNHPDNAVKVREIITSTLKGLSRLVPVEKEKNIPVYEVDSNGETPLQMAETSNLAPVLLKQYVPYIGRSNAEVVDLFVKIGNPVTKGDSLIMLEINQENMEVVAAYSGIVKDVKVGVGDKVNEGDVIIILESNESYLSSITKKLPAKIGTVVKGFMGSGTEADPLLISSVEDFMDLARADVGQKGYHFRQTADLDFSNIEPWPEFDFKGHYEGGGFKIIARPGTAIINNLCDSSTVKKVQLKNGSLANTVSSSEIHACNVDHYRLIKFEANNSYFTSCSAGAMAGDANDCHFKNCQVTKALVKSDYEPRVYSSFFGMGMMVKESQEKESRGHAVNCKIVDCEVVLYSSNTGGGIADYLLNTTVEKSIVSGQNDRDDGYVFAGLVLSCAEKSVIKCCALGLLSIRNKAGFDARIVKEMSADCQLDKNISIQGNRVKNSGEETFNGKEGKTISAVQWTQRYFELTLGWDFEQVWQWDQQNNVPTLRQVGVTAAVLKTTTTEQTPKQDGEKMVDLLALQLKDNLWI